MSHLAVNGVLVLVVLLLAGAAVLTVRRSRRDDERSRALGQHDVYLVSNENPRRPVWAVQPTGAEEAAPSAYAWGHTIDEEATTDAA